MRLKGQCDVQFSSVALFILISYPFKKEINATAEGCDVTACNVSVRTVCHYVLVRTLYVEINPPILSFAVVVQLFGLLDLSYISEA